jgi:hypothetical protein
MACHQFLDWLQLTHCVVGSIFLAEGTIVESRLSLPAILGALLAMQSAMAAVAVPAAKETQVLERVNVSGTNREMGMGVSEFPPNAEKPAIWRPDQRSATSRGER